MGRDTQVIESQTMNHVVTWPDIDKSLTRIIITCQTNSTLLATSEAINNSMENFSVILF